MFFDDFNLSYKKRAFERKDLTVPPRAAKPVDYFTTEELVACVGSDLVFDIEDYKNYFLVSFQHVESGKVIYFEMRDGEVLNLEWLAWIVFNFCIIGFNSRNYDLPILSLALCGANVERLYQATQSIIRDGMQRRDLEKEYKFKIIQCNHIDLIEVAPLDGSLKLYAARIHAPRLQDLPFDPHLSLDAGQIVKTREYNINDLDLTRRLFKFMHDRIELRKALSADFGEDLRSKSDAQIAEAVIAGQVSKINGRWPKRPQIAPGTSYRYRAPVYLRYQTPALVALLERVVAADFVVAGHGGIEMPPALTATAVRVGADGVYRMGIGGLHSSEKVTAVREDNEHLLIDRDVASYYPNIILNQELYPEHMGRTFLTVYKARIDRRLGAKARVGEAKKAGLIPNPQDVVMDKGGKIEINGSFGKFGSMWSSLYAPDLMIQVTVTGQLTLLLLIERLELAGIRVVSANTDGVVSHCPRHLEQTMLNVIALWERETGFVTEETRYKALYSRDVNSYIAITLEGKTKVKGAYSEVGSASGTVLDTNPSNQICADAVSAYLTKNVSIEETIRNSRDITRFITVRNVNGAAEKDGIFLGKTIRWYYANDIDGEINYITNGNKVGRSENAKPCLDLPDEFPADVNYQWYIDECHKILEDIAFVPRSNVQARLL